MARKSIEEMLSAYSPEEWRQMIETEMDQLGLYFSEAESHEYVPLFDNLKQNSYSFKLQNTTTIRSENEFNYQLEQSVSSQDIVLATNCYDIDQNRSPNAA